MRLILTGDEKCSGKCSGCYYRWREHRQGTKLGCPTDHNLYHKHNDIAVGINCKNIGDLELMDKVLDY
jgi:hypothetical protein